MEFPWNKYKEMPLESRPTLQVFITNRCNLKCEGCFARNVMKDGDVKDISMATYTQILDTFLHKGGKQINMLGGEPLLHKDISKFCKLNKALGIKTTIYTNGYLIDRYCSEDFHGAKLRLSVYCMNGKVKVASNVTKGIKFDVNYMVSAGTTLKELLETAKYSKDVLDSKVFFISSIRELDNPDKEFFNDTKLTMPVLEYKKLVHDFLTGYNGNMDLHISKRGVFESSTSLPNTKCNFANIFPSGKIVQCPYDVVNMKYQSDYEFGSRYCQHNNTCLMSKIILKRKR